MNRVAALAAALMLAVLIALVWWDAGNPDVMLLQAFLVAQLPSALTVGLIAVRTSALSARAIPFGLALRANSLAIAGTLLLPARLSELGKPLHFRAVSGFPTARGLALVIEERVWDAAALALMIVLTLSLMREQVGAGLGDALWLVGGAALAGLAVLTMLPRLCGYIPALARLNERHGIFRRRNVLGVAGMMGLSILIWAMSAAILVAAYEFSGLPTLALDQLLVLFTVSTLGLAVSITPGSLGTYEGSIVGVLAFYDVSWDAGLAFAIGFRMCWMAVPVLLALLTLRIDGPLLMQARRDREESA